MTPFLLLVGLAGAIPTKTPVDEIKIDKVKEARATIATLSKGADMYYTDCGHYPSTAEGLQALVEPVSSCKNWGPKPYTAEVTNDPWGLPYVYVSRNGQDFEIRSLGADGREGGVGEDADITSEKF